MIAVLPTVSSHPSKVSEPKKVKVSAQPALTPTRQALSH
jgi:hypothetical protein